MSPFFVHYDQKSMNEKPSTPLEADTTREEHILTNWQRLGTKLVEKLTNNHFYDFFDPHYGCSNR